MNLEDDIIEIYCAVEEVFRDVRLRKRGFSPCLSDAEVLTMEIVGELQGRHTDAAIWRYFRDHWLEWFPRLGSYPNFAKHCANLRFAKERVMAALFPASRSLYIIDGVPMPLCRRARAYRCRSLKGEAAYGYCAAKDEHYYGLRGHPVIDDRHRIVHCTFTPANADERGVLDNLRGFLRGMLIGDKGFLSQAWQESLRGDGIDLQTPSRKNMTETRPEAFLAWLYKTRKAVETAISLLTEMFAFNRIRARDTHHFTNKAARKILAYNFYVSAKS